MLSMSSAVVLYGCQGSASVASTCKHRAAARPQSKQLLCLTVCQQGAGAVRYAFMGEVKMKRTHVAFVALLLGLLVTVPSCGSTPENPTKTKIAITGVGSYEVEGTTPQTWSINIPLEEGKCWKMTWTNSAGEELGSACGSGPAAGQAPGGAAHVDTTIIDCTDCETEGLGGEAWPEGWFPYVFFKAPTGFTATETYVSTSVRVTSPSLPNAELKAFTVEQGGPGTPLPSYVDVLSFFTVDLVGSDLVVKSSLAQRFGRYTITLNGTTVLADKASQLNVSGSSPGNGWLTLTSLIPAAVAQPGNEIVITQSAMGGASEVTVTVTF